MEIILAKGALVSLLRLYRHIILDTLEFGKWI